MEFPYGEQELAHLRAKDRKLGAAIDRIGHVRREMEPDLFASVIHHIIGQQVSMAAQRTVWERLRQAAGTVTAETILDMGREQLQSFGMTYRKADYILDFAERVHSGAFDLEKLYTMDDEEVKASLSSLRGIGPWTAEMLMLFSMGRPDIVSYGDLAILRGMRMLYGRKPLTVRRLTGIADAILPMGPQPACIFGPLPAVPCRSFGTRRRQNRKE